MQTAEVIPFNKQEIAAFSEFRSQLATLKHDNEKAVFNYDDPKGNKEARSHVYKLRQTRAAVEKVRKEQKADALEYGRKVDQQAKEISEEIDGMIELHEAPLRAIEEKEAARVKAHKDRIAAIGVYLDGSESAEVIAGAISRVEAVVIDESFQEFRAEALMVKTDVVEGLRKRHAAQVAQEEQAAELARLRAESIAREQKEREEKIAREAREHAERAAALKAEAERIARESAEREAAAKAERDRIAKQQEIEQAKAAQEAAERRAIEAERIAKEKAERDIKDAQEAERREIEKREADKTHRAKINNAAVAKLIALGLIEADAKMVITAIAKKEIPAVSIAY